MAATVALTGATGFLGRALTERLLAEGWKVRALLRRPAPDLEAKGAISVFGALEQEDSLESLLEGCDAVVHCAGLVRARSRSEFLSVNADGTARLVKVAAALSRPPRFLLVSSLAAREPSISAYAASKRGGEEALVEFGGRLEHCTLRPPGIYGPGDRATLPLFRQLARGFLFVPAVPAARFSLLHVQDLAAAVERLLAQEGWSDAPLDVDDGRDDGYGWQDLAEMAGRQLGRRVRQIAVPRSLLWLPAQVSQHFAGVRGRSTYFTPGKMREFFHPNWVARRVADGPLGGWRAKFTFETGFSQTLEWYRAEGWLR